MKQSQKSVNVRSRLRDEQTEWPPFTLAVIPAQHAPTKKLDELIRAGRIAHGGHPVLRWMAGNVSIEQDAADNWKPSKKKSIERIDGIVALIMGLDRATMQPPPYQWSGPLVVAP